MEATPITLATKCKHCGKAKGNHQARTGACPSGEKTKIGYIHFNDSVTFSPVFKLNIGDKIRIKNSTIDLITNIERVSKDKAFAGEFCFDRFNYPLVLMEMDAINWGKTQYIEKPILINPSGYGVSIHGESSPKTRRLPFLPYGMRREIVR